MLTHPVTLAEIIPVVAVIVVWLITILWGTRSCDMLLAKVVDDHTDELLALRKRVEDLEDAR